MLKKFTYTIGFVLALGSAGCAHINPEAALEGAQTGLAGLDVASKKLAEDYSSAVLYIRRECAEDVACMQRYKVDNESVLKVLTLFRLLAEGYDQSAEAVQTLQEAWQALSPLVKEVMEAKEKIVR